MDMREFVAAVVPELHRRLAPMNIQVFSREKPWPYEVRFIFECHVRVSGHFFNGRRIAIDKIVSEKELYYELNPMKNDEVRRAYAKVVAEKMSREILLGFYDYFSKLIPQSPEFDYRPQEVIPEDFYSA